MRTVGAKPPGGFAQAESREKDADIHHALAKSVGARFVRGCREAPDGIRASPSRSPRHW